MSHYTFLGAGYYFSYKDIYIILFLIFFIELFVHSKLRSLFIILICLIATVSILLQIDRGTYIYFVLFFYFLYSLIAKKYNDALLIFFSLIICWIIVINLIGFEDQYYKIVEGILIEHWGGLVAEVIFWWIYECSLLLWDYAKSHSDYEPFYEMDYWN